MVEVTTGDATVPVSPHEVAAWLGVRPDQVVDCGPRPRRGLELGLVLCAAVGLTVAAGLMLEDAAELRLYGHDEIYQRVSWALLSGLGWGTFYGLWPLAVAVLRISDRLFHRLRADAFGLTVGTGRFRRRYGWGQVWGVERCGRSYLLRLPGRQVALNAGRADAQRVLQAARAGLAATAAGRALPAPEALPSGAISVAPERGEAAARGLSRGGRGG